jgi:hypothetical protein
LFLWPDHVGLNHESTHLEPPAAPSYISQKNVDVNQFSCVQSQSNIIGAGEQPSEADDPPRAKTKIVISDLT